MEMIRKTSFLLYVVSTLFLYSCTSREKDILVADLYQNFYEMNRENKFEGLYNLEILGIRDRAEFDSENHKYVYVPSCIGIRDSFGNMQTCLPSFPEKANNEVIKKFYSRISASDSAYLRHKYRNLGTSSIFDDYVSEIRSIYHNYYRIKVPKVLPQANIKISGRLDYIVFYLYEDKSNGLLCRVYYLKDNYIISKDNLIDFDKKVKINKNWYHDSITSPKIDR